MAAPGRTIPIEVQLKLVEVPPNLRAILSQIGQTLQSLGQVRVTPGALTPETTRKLAAAGRELTAVQKDLSTVVTSKVYPAWTQLSKGYIESQMVMRALGRQQLRFIQLVGAGSLKAAALNSALATGQIRLFQTAKGLKVVGDASGYFGAALREGTIRLIQTRDGLVAVSPQVADFTRQIGRSTIEIGKARVALGLVAGQLGSVGLAVRGLLRELFWLGLGSMFITMSFARVRRQQQALERGMYSYRKALVAVRRSQRRVTEAILEFGYGSEEAQAAQEAYEESIMRVRMVEEQMRAQVEQTTLAYMMLAFGTIPTLLRVGSELFTRFLQLFLSMKLNETQSWKSAIAQAFLGDSMLAASAKASALGTSIMYAAVAMGLLTGGVTLLTFALSQWYLQNQLAAVEDRMKKLRREFNLTEIELTRRSLVDSLYQTTDAFKELSKASNQFITRPGQLGRLGATISFRALNIGSIQINATVRREEDIRKIRNTLEDLFIKGYYRRGGL